MITITEGIAFKSYLSQSDIFLAILCTAFAAGLVIFLTIRIRDSKSSENLPHLTYISFALLLLTVVLFALNNLIIKENMEMLLAALAGYMLDRPSEAGKDVKPEKSGGKDLGTKKY